MNSTAKIYEDKERVKLRKEMLVQSKLEHSSDGSIFVLFRQEDKDFHQVKSWSPTQQLVIKSIIPNFSL